MSVCRRYHVHGSVRRVVFIDNLGFVHLHSLTRETERKCTKRLRIQRSLLHYKEIKWQIYYMKQH